MNVSIAYGAHNTHRRPQYLRLLYLAIFGSQEGRTVPPGFWRRHSKGRLSWSDDYQGGCLAEYYEVQSTRLATKRPNAENHER